MMEEFFLVRWPFFQGSASMPWGGQAISVTTFTLLALSVTTSLVKGKWLETAAKHKVERSSSWQFESVSHLYFVTFPI
jgi:hypothetical protein